MKRIILIVLLVSGFARAGQDCTGNPLRMADIESKLALCVKGSGGQEARHLILYGRYNGNFSAMVKRGYGLCLGDKDREQNFGSCDDASFWVAARELLPTEAYGSFPEAQKNPEQ